MKQGIGSSIKSIIKKKISTETLWNLAVNGDESFVANGIVVHNCRSTLIPLTKYEEFTPTKSIRGMSPTDFVDENKGAGFAYYKKEESPKEETLEIDIDHPEVEFVTEKNGEENITTYSYKGKEFYRITTKNDSDGNVISLKRARINEQTKV